MDEKVISNAFSANKKKAYLSDKMIQLINKQIQLEFNAGQLYKAMATWCEYAGWEGLSKFMKGHIGDEHSHMQKLYSYALDRQVNPITPMVIQQPTSFKDLKDILERSLAHEELIENSYKEAVKIALSENDHTSYHFLLWYLEEQVEEIALMSKWLDRLNIVGCDQKGMFFVDQEILESLG